MEYKELEVWLETRKLNKYIFETTCTFPNQEIYGLTNQMRRSAVSIVSNIAEGCGRDSVKDSIRFLFISRGSIYELETQLYLSFDQEYITEQQLSFLLNQISLCKKLLNGFINYFKKIEK